MFRTLGKSKIAFVLAILFGISLLFFKTGSRYSNFFNSDNVIANVSGTSISTSKFNRTLQMNIDQFNRILGKQMTGEDVKNFQIHTLALRALINEAVFENEYDNIGFKIDETVVAQKTKERIPQLYDKNNKLNELYLSQFLQQQKLKIEDIVQIIDFETRDRFFDDTFFKINYPDQFANKIFRYNKHTRKIKHIQIPLELIDIENIIQANSVNIDKILEEYYKENLSRYMSKEKRSVEYVTLNKNDYKTKYSPSDFEILDYYNNNKDLYFEKEKRSFIQFNFNTLEEAKEIEEKISSLNNADEIINFSNNNNIKLNLFKNLTSDEVLENIASTLFALEINQKSEIIQSPLANHIIVLQAIANESQLQLKDVKEKIKESITNIELSNYFTELNADISKKILDGKTLSQIVIDLDLKLNNIQNLTKDYTNFETSQNEFFNSLIPNVFSANKDFVSDTIDINPDFFYIFNVVNIIPSQALNLTDVEKKVYEDWKTSKKIEEIKNQLSLNKNNEEYLNKISKYYDIKFQNTEVNQNYSELPKNLINNIFNSPKNINTLTFDNNNVYIAQIIEILIPSENDNKSNISLMSNLRNSFGNELIKNKNISTNDNLINAVVNSY